MGSVSNYWRFVRLDGVGQCRIKVIPEAKQYMQQQFPAGAIEAQRSDAAMQRSLVDSVQTAIAAANWAIATAGLWCLRCFISTQIEQVCRHLERQFGEMHSLQAREILPFVLDDAGEPWSMATMTGLFTATPPPTATFTSLAARILQSFDGAQGSLTTWVIRLVRNHRELNQALLEQGIYLVSDWAILNDTQPRQLTRILGEFHALSLGEVAQASDLLQRYHAVYRRDRLTQRQQGGRRRCVPPTRRQLMEMAAGATGPEPEAVLRQLQTLAGYLRQYRISVRGGTPVMDSLDQVEVNRQVQRLHAQAETDEDREMEQFLAQYRQEFLNSLRETIEQVTRDRVAYWQQRQPASAPLFLQALVQFHCQGQSMTAIAQAIGLKQQYQVTRLLKLKDFRTDVHQRLLLTLRDRVHHQAQAYLTPDRLSQLATQIDHALDSQITELLQAAEQEASTGRDRPFQNLFAQTLCQQIATWSLTR